jgi:hypothetical protein
LREGVRDIKKEKTRMYLVVLVGNYRDWYEFMIHDSFSLHVYIKREHTDFLVRHMPL